MPIDHEPEGDHCPLPDAGANGPTYWQSYRVEILGSLALLAGLVSSPLWMRGEKPGEARSHRTLQVLADGYAQKSLEFHLNANGSRIDLRHPPEKIQPYMDMLTRGDIVLPGNALTIEVNAADGTPLCPITIDPQKLQELMHGRMAPSLRADSDAAIEKIGTICGFSKEHIEAMKASRLLGSTTPGASPQGPYSVVGEGVALGTLRSPEIRLG